MPVSHVLGVAGEVRARLVEAVVELQIQVVRLQVLNHEDGGHGRREATEGVEDVLGLKGDALAYRTVSGESNSAMVRCQP